MFIEATKLIDLPIAATESQSKIGQIKEILVDPENGQILGFLIQTGGIFAGQKALAAIDIQNWDPNGVVISSAENFVDPTEIVRIKNILDKKIILLGMRAKTEQGKSLGAVENFLVDTDTLIVTKYYLKDLLGNSRIFPADKVVKIDKEIIFDEDVSEPTGGAVETQAV